MYRGGEVSLWGYSHLLQFIFNCLFLRHNFTLSISIISPIPHSELEIGTPPSELSIHNAFLIFPIAHQYEFKAILNACSRAVIKERLDIWPSDPIASSEVPHHPGLVQWLVLADAKQCDSILDSCLARLTAYDASKDMRLIREALASPTLSRIMEGLRPETMIKAMRLMAGLPINKVVMYNDIMVTLITLVTLIDITPRL